MRTIDQVMEFHERFELHDHTNAAPTLPSFKVRLGRVQGLSEEVAELAHALGKSDIIGAVDALCDIQYFLDGTFIALGLAEYKDAAFAEVHRSNMTKLGSDGRPLRDASGRIVKGPAYERPDLRRVLHDRMQLRGHQLTILDE